MMCTIHRHYAKKHKIIQKYFFFLFTCNFWKRFLRYSIQASIMISTSVVTEINFEAPSIIYVALLISYLFSYLKLTSALFCKKRVLFMESSSNLTFSVFFKIEIYYSKHYAWYLKNSETPKKGNSQS